MHDLGTSAPSSPAKSRESLLQRVQSLTGAARDQGANLIGAAASTVSRVQAFNKDRCFTLLVIDDQNTDWSKYFRGKRLHGELNVWHFAILITQHFYPQHTQVIMTFELNKPSSVKFLLLPAAMRAQQFPLWVTELDQRWFKSWQRVGGLNFGNTIFDFSDYKVVPTRLCSCSPSSTRRCQGLSLYFVGIQIWRCSIDQLPQ